MTSPVTPNGRIPQDCLEMDKESCVFARRKRRSSKTDEYESSEDERRENPYSLDDKSLDSYY